MGRLALEDIPRQAKRWAKSSEPCPCFFSYLVRNIANMPLIQITMVQGRDEGTVTQCAKEVALAVHRCLAAPLESIRVVVNQVPASQWIIGERSKAEIDANKESHT